MCRMHGGPGGSGLLRYESPMNSWGLMGINTGWTWLNSQWGHDGIWWNMLYLGFDHAIPVCLVFGVCLVCFNRGRSFPSSHHPRHQSLPAVDEKWIFATWMWSGPRSQNLELLRQLGRGRWDLAKCHNDRSLFDLRALEIMVYFKIIPFYGPTIQVGEILFFYPDGMMLGGWMMVMLGGLMDVGWC